MTTDQLQTSASSTQRGRRLGGALANNSYLIPLLVVLVAGLVLVPRFATMANLSNVLMNTSILAVIAFGSTLVIALRGLDLSVGALQGLTACTAAVTTISLGPTVGILAGIALGAIAGAANGVLIAYFRLPAFVVTLGMMSLARGAALIISDGSSVRVPASWVTDLAAATFGPIPLLFVFAIVVGVLFTVMLGNTVFGRHILAVGGSPESAADSGIDTRRVTVGAFVLSGLSASIGGVMLLGQLGSASGTMGQGLELQVIAVVVLGGTALSGGVGNMVGTFAAALLMAMINSALNLLNVPSFYQYLAVGLVLLGALWLESARRSLVGARERRAVIALDRKQGGAE